MRFLVLPLLFLPSLAVADDFVLSAPVGAVTVHPFGATLERRAVVDVPAGAHRLIVQDLPAGVDLRSLRLMVEGAVKGEVVMRDRFVPPRDVASPAVDAAEAEVARIKEAVAGIEDARARVLAARDAATARLEFLRQLGEGEGVAAQPVADLRDLIGMIGEQAAAARRAQVDAEAEARGFAVQLDDLAEELARAEAALAALRPEVEARAYVAVSVVAEQAGEVALVLRNFADAVQWQPVYDLHLDRKAGKLRIARGAYVAQDTGENWKGVAVTLSTSMPAEGVTPRSVYAQRMRIVDPVAPAPRSVMRSQADMGMMAAPVMEERVMAEKAASVSFDGLVAEYRYDSPLDLVSGADVVRIALGEVSLDADIRARAVPLYEDRAFIEAEVRNTTGEPILAGMSYRYRDGVFVGGGDFPSIPAGGEEALFFGPIDGLVVKRTVLERQEGDRGVISKSNAREESLRIDLENLTGEAWNLRVIDRVPYSEQEDLQITYQARPAASEKDLDGQRGVLAWDMKIGAGEKQQIGLDTVIKWPEGKVLQ
ncbi:MAG: DUF4139 domain-containing protein [Paracoccaceae bacterium]